MEPQREGQGWDPHPECVVLSPTLSAAWPEFQKGRDCLSFLPLNLCDRPLPPRESGPVPPFRLICPLPLSVR